MSNPENPSGPLSLLIRIGDEALGGVITQTLERVGDTLSQTSFAARLRRWVQDDDAQHRLVRQIINEAVIDASTGLEIPHQTLKLFVDDNHVELVKAILEVVVIDGDYFSLRAARREEREALRQFVQKLPDTIQRARHRLLPPGDLALENRIDALAEQVGGLRSEVREGVRHNTDLNSQLDILANFSEQAPALTAALQQFINQQEGTLPAVLREKLRERVAKIEGLLESQNLRDVISEGKRLLEEIEGLGEQELTCKVHRLLAGAYTLTELQEKEALPHLKKVVELTKEDDVRLRNQALVHLYSGNPEKTLELVDSALAEGAKDFRLVSIRINALFQLGRFPELLEYVEHEIRHGNWEAPNEKAGLLLGLATILRREGDFASAQNCCTTILDFLPDNARVHAFLGELVLEDVVQQRDSGRLAWEDRAERLEVLLSALRHLSRAIELSKDQRPGFAARAYYNRAGIKFWQEDYVGGLTDLITALPNLSRPEDVYPNLINGALISGRTDLITPLLEDIKGASRRSKEVAASLAGYYLEIKDPASAIRLLESLDAKNDDPGKEDRTPLWEPLLRAYEADLRPSEAKLLIVHIVERDPKNAELLLLKAKDAWLKGAQDEAIELMRQAYEQAEGRVGALAAHELAGMVFQRAEELFSKTGNNNEVAQDLFIEALCRNGALSTAFGSVDAERRRVASLYRLGRLQACVETCERFLEREFDPRIAHVLVAVYVNARHYQKAEAWARRLAVEHPKDPHYLLDFCTCLLRLGRFEEAAENVEKLVYLLQDDLDGLVRIAVILLAGRQAEKALRILLDVLKKSGYDVNYHRLLVSYSFTFSKVIGHPNAVSKDLKAEFYRAVGLFFERHPDDSAYRQFPIDPDKPRESLAALRPDMANPLPTELAPERALEKGRIPLAFAASLTGHSLPDVWFRLTGKGTNYGASLKTDTTRALDRSVHLLSASENVKGDAVVVDAVGLLTLDRLNLFDLLGNTFHKVLVPRSIVEMIRDWIFFEETQRGHDRLSLHFDETDVHVEGISAAKVDTFVDKVRVLLERLETPDFTIIGDPVERNEVIPEWSLLLEMVSVDQAFDSLFLAREHGAWLFAEEVLCRDLAWNDGLQIPSLNSRSLIEWSFKAERLSFNRFQACKAALALMGYKHVLIDTFTLLSHARKYDFLPILPARAPLLRLADPELDQASVYRVVASFLEAIWNYLPQKWTGSVEGDRRIKEGWTQVVYTMLVQSDRHTALKHLEQNQKLPAELRAFVLKMRELDEIKE